MKNLYFLRIDNDSLDEARAYQTLAGAKRAFRIVAAELWRYGQACSATVHIAPRPAELVEYPEYVLMLGPRGGLQVDRA